MRFLVGIVGLLSLVSIAPAKAGTVTFEVFEVQSVAISSGTGPAVLSYEPFDPSKGELKRVDVQLTYTATTTLLVAPNFVFAGPFPVPTPYTAPLIRETKFTSFFEGFSSATSALEPTAFTADGAQTTGTLFAFYNYGFSVEPPTPVNTSVGPVVTIGSGASLLDPVTTEDFLPINPFAASVDRITGLEVSVTSFDERITPVTTGLTGTMLLTYVYDRTIEVHDPDDPPADPPAVVPLPAAFWMLVGGLGALGALRARRA